MNRGDEFDSSEGEISEASSTEETAEDLEIIQYTEIFSLKGVSYHPEFQVTIAHCRKCLAENQAVSVHLRHEQDNGEDKNAVIVETFCRATGNPLGTFLGKKCQKSIMQCMVMRSSLQLLDLYSESIFMHCKHFCIFPQ